MIKKEKHYKLLSYPLKADTPEYGGGRSFRIKRDKMIARGDSCNASILSFSNHLGTHMDCPNHFLNSGKNISQYKTEDFIFSRPVLLHCPKPANGFITEKDISRNYQKLKKADILLLKTGFYRHRKKSRYVLENPGISPEAARFIRTYLGNIRCVGIDTISISAYRFCDLGRQTHGIFFNDKFRSKPVRLIEDMDLSGKLKAMKTVYAFPFFMGKIDSSPCAVLGVLKE